MGDSFSDSFNDESGEAKQVWQEWQHTVLLEFPDFVQVRRLKAGELITTNANFV